MKRIIAIGAALLSLIGCKQIDTPGELYSGADYVYINKIILHDKNGELVIPPFQSDSIHIYNGMSSTYVETLSVTLMGNLSDENRPILLEQGILEGDEMNQAYPGIHYDAFDDEVIASLYTIRRGENSAELPIYINNVTVSERTAVALTFRIGPNEYFNNTDQTSPNYTIARLILVYHPEQVVEP